VGGDVPVSARGGVMSLLLHSVGTRSQRWRKSSRWLCCFVLWFLPSYLLRLAGHAMDLATRVRVRGCRGGGPCPDGSTAGDVAVVMAVSWGHEGGKELVSGAPGVGGASAWSMPISRGRSSARGRLVV
jgi:hypothetical protein